MEDRGLTDISQPLLDVRGVTLQYKTREFLVTATYRVDFQVHKAERFVILGPSGCGKTTLLKAVGGYLHPTEGTISLSGEMIKRPGPDRVFVFQEFDQLLPWKTVKQNVEFALVSSGKLRGRAAQDQAMQYIEMVKLTQFANTYPHMLSGGMKQRVAIARAMAMEPEMLLMDEPFAALDALTRRKMQEELLQLWEDTHFTMLFVTHSIPEAVLLGNRVLLMSPHPGQVKAELNSDGRDNIGADGKKLTERIQNILFDDEVEEEVASHARPTDAATGVCARSRNQRVRGGRKAADDLGEDL